MGQGDSLPVLEASQISISLKGRRLAIFPFRVSQGHPIETIDLSNNIIKELPRDLHFLQVLDLSENSFDSLPPKIINSICSYKSLTILKLNYNHLKELPPELNTIPTLKLLSVCGNQLTGINMDFPSLCVLDISCNQIKTIDKIPPSLTSLSLAFNKLTEIEFSSSTLQNLVISGNYITRFPEDVVFDSLVSLDISHNNLICLPNMKKMFPTLSSFTGDHNFIEEMTSDLPPTLLYVNLSCNRICKAPSSLAECRSLKTLRLNNNMLQVLPSLPYGIEYLDIENNMISSTSPFGSGRLQTLSISRNSFTKLPKFNRSIITTLHAASNQLASIDTSSLSHILTRCDLSANKLTILPSSIFSIPSLKHLILNNNQLTEIPQSFENSALVSLSISNNPIKKLPSLPSTLCVLNAVNCLFETFPLGNPEGSVLSMIDFSFNSLTALPDLPNLTLLRCSGNKLTCLPLIPHGIVSIDVSGNQITEVVLQEKYIALVEADFSHNSVSNFVIGRAPSLRFLKLANNPVNKGINIDEFESLTHYDIAYTNIEPVYQNRLLVELIVTDPAFFSKLSCPAIKYFNGPLVGYSETIGLRESMEDSIIIRENLLDGIDMYAVLDGHAGFTSSVISSFLIPKLFIEQGEFSPVSLSIIVNQVNNELRARDIDDGTTLTLALRRNRDLISLNIGDSRHLIVKKDGTVVPLTVDHKPDDKTEIEMIREQGGSVMEGRIDGSLAVSRSLGDFLVKGVSAIPTITEYSLQEDDFRLVLGCDGVFDVLSNEAVGQLAIIDVDPHISALRIKSEAFALGSDDNISVIVVNLDS